MTALTFYGGVREIGGNKILLEDKGTEILLDFGESFTAGTDFFYEYLQPRGVCGAKDYFFFDMLPKVKGLYGREELKFTDLKYEKPEVEGLFVSHAHVDHISHVGFLDESIPLYCGEATKTFMDAYRETTSSVDYGEREYRTFRSGRKIQKEIEPLTVEPVHVDHSIPAAYGYIIHTSGGAVVYTGDLRLHGPKSNMTEEFIKKAASSDPVAMICEGTRVGPDPRKNFTEEQVKEESGRIVSSAGKRLVLACCYTRDIDRMNTLYTIAKENDRIFAISLKAAYLLRKLKDDPKLKVPDVLRDENIQIYFKRKKSGEYNEKEYYMWERPFLENSVKADDVRKNKSKYLLSMDFWSFAELIDIEPEPGTDFIHSMSEPFSEEDLQKDVMDNWIAHFKLNRHQIHASGHASGPEIIEIINEVKPKKVFPVHTGHPEEFRVSKGIEVVNIEKGAAYQI
jgi:ribonuclease J